MTAAMAIGFPVALKALGPTMLHKTERRAVRLNLGDADDVHEAASEFERGFGSELSGFLVQRMVEGVSRC